MLLNNDANSEDSLADNDFEPNFEKAEQSSKEDCH